MSEHDNTVEVDVMSCGNCGKLEFYIVEGGTLQCCDCHNPVNNIFWMPDEGVPTTKESKRYAN